MERLIAHFRKAHQLIISGKTAQRLAETVPAMHHIDSAWHFQVTGYDESAMLPRSVDVTLRELQAAVKGRNVA